MATLVTPNVPEAEALAGMTITTETDMAEAGRRIQALGVHAVLIKGGHLKGTQAADTLVGPGGKFEFTGRRIDTKQTHGTGCTYSAAITAGLAKGLVLTKAIGRAKIFVQSAIETAPGLGQGFGPVNHFAPVD
jgi:hydroxymethylpyrimidine/phosphomethylpyrimidine kinase